MALVARAVGRCAVTVTRRGFLQLLGAAIAAASVDATKRGEATGGIKQREGGTRHVHARHLYGYLIEDNRFAHRIDLIYDGKQVGVDFVTVAPQLDERALVPALAQLNAYIADDNVQVGEIFTYSFEQWHRNDAARKRWGRIGDNLPDTERLAHA